MIELLKNSAIKIADTTLFNQDINQKIQSGDPRGAIAGLINNIVTILLFAIGVLSVIFIIIGGLQYILSGGDQNKLRSAKQTLVAAIGGLLAALVLGAILTQIYKIFGLT